MKKITLLAELTCLNKLVNGKVVVIDIKNNTYKTYNPGKYTPPMPEEFNPEDYALLETNHCPVIVEATPKMKEEYLVNKYWREQCTNKLLKYRDLKKNEHNYNVGDRVHLHDKDGIYTIHNIVGRTFQLTCSTWNHTDRPVRSYDVSCIKCLAGGINLGKGI